VLRYAYCTLFPSVKRLPAPLRASQPASQLGRERETRDSEGERHTGPKHTHTHTHTHARHLHQHPPSALSTRPFLHVCCNPAAGIALSLHHAQSSRLSRPHETRLCCPTPHSTAPIAGTCRRPHCPLRHSNTPTLAFHQEIEPVASGRKIEEPPIGDAEGCIRWTPGLEAWTILKSNPFVNLVEILQHRTTPYTQCEQTDACELAESHQRIALPALASDDQTVLSLLSHIN
jgi:hypothetical protein